MNRLNRFLIQGCSVIIMLIFAGAACSQLPDKEVERLIYVNHASLNMFVGDIVQLTASPTIETYTWESRDTSVATVNQTGEVTATGAGETEIVVTSGELSKEIQVIVAQ